MDDRQVFVHGDDLKADLAKLDAHYSSLLSDEEKLRGVMSFAHYPPVVGDFLVSKLWDKLMNPEWRKWAVRPPVIESKESEAKIIAEINKLTDAPRLNACSEANGGWYRQRSKTLVDKCTPEPRSSASPSCCAVRSFRQ
jgi:hypothetical protein